MIHLVVVLSAVVLTPSDATPAVHSTVPSLPAAPSPLGHTLAPHSVSISTSTIQTTPVTSPASPLPSINFPNIAHAILQCQQSDNYYPTLQSKDNLLLFLSLLQTNKDNKTHTYTSSWNQIWQSHLWMCIHSSIMKPTFPPLPTGTPQAKYMKDSIQVHFRHAQPLLWPYTNRNQVQVQINKETDKQISNSRPSTNRNEPIQWNRIPIENAQPQEPIENYDEILTTHVQTQHLLVPVTQTPINKNEDRPQKERESSKLMLHSGKDTNKCKHSLKMQSPIKLKDELSQLQKSTIKEQEVQILTSSENSKQISQVLTEKLKPQTSTDMITHLLKATAPIDIKAQIDQIQSPINKQTPKFHVDPQKDGWQQKLKRSSDIRKIKARVPLVPLSSNVGVETSIPLSQISVEKAEQVSVLNHTLQSPSFLTTPKNCNGSTCKSNGRKSLYFYLTKNIRILPSFSNMNSRLTSFNEPNRVRSEGVISDHAKNMLPKNGNSQHSNNETFNVDSEVLNSSNNSLSKTNTLLKMNNIRDVLVPNNEAGMTNAGSLRLLDNKCTKSFNKNCIFKRSARTDTMNEDSHLSNVVNMSDITTVRENRSYSDNTTNSNKVTSNKRDENLGVNTSLQGKISTNVNSDKEQKSKSKISKQGRMRRGREYRRLDRRRKNRGQEEHNRDFSLWIDRKQVKIFSGYMMEIYAIHNGRVLPYILDPNFEKQLPVIPSEVENVNFTWSAGSKRYYYTFDRLYSQDEVVLEVPVLSLPTHGRVPKKPKVFSVKIHCTGNASGIATFGIGLLIQTRLGRPLPGTPLRLKLRKECTQIGPDPECDQKCENGGVCDEGQRCLCPEGYMGQYCNTALCYPQCMNGGTCTTPGRCSCPPGFQGRHCEGGICQDKCQNGGKCVQKDTCDCRRGYYGNRCEFSKCVIPCINGGRCRDVNKCRCPRGFAGDHCEVVLGQNVEASATTRCTRRCRHGTCKKTTCYCHEGYTGRWCRRRGGNMSGKIRKKVWV